MAGDYTVQEGDCIGSIAFANGFTWSTLWNDPSNAALKQKRKDPNLLLSGDVVHIPDLRIEQVPCATDQRHSFRLKGVPAKLKIQLLKEEMDQNPGQAAANPDGDTSYEDPDYRPKQAKNQPRTNVPYLLNIDGTLMSGQSDGSGYIVIPLSPGAREGRLLLNPGTPQEEVYPLQLGGMDPIDELAGVQKRLQNLGFASGSDPGGDGGITPELEAALSLFQQAQGLPITGKLDDSSRSKLKQVHGG